MIVTRKVLWWLLAASRGGKNRYRIIKSLEEKPKNANQLSETLELDYKTIKHHLKKLKENNIVTSAGESYGKTYFLSDAMEENIEILEEIDYKEEDNENEE